MKSILLFSLQDKTFFFSFWELSAVNNNVFQFLKFSVFNLNSKISKKREKNMRLFAELTE